MIHLIVEYLVSDTFFLPNINNAWQLPPKNGGCIYQSIPQKWYALKHYKQQGLGSRH